MAEEPGVEAALAAAAKFAAQTVTDSKFFKSLDSGVKTENLYLQTGGQQLNTGAVSGRNRIQAMDARSASIYHREITNSAAAPEVPQPKKKRGDPETLKQWFGLPRQEMTPEKKAMLMALQLRGVAHKDRFYKGNDGKELPKYFAIGTEVPHTGGALRVGGGAESQAMGTANRRHRKGRSLLSELLRDTSVTEFANRQYSKLVKERQVFKDKPKGKKIKK